MKSNYVELEQGFKVINYPVNYEGRPINKLQNGIILLIFKI